MKGIASLTGIRGVAALAVIFYHIYLTGTELGYTFLHRFPLLESGWIGVDLFFVLSGFILTYAHRGDFDRINRRSLGHFARLRIWRIYPLSTCVLLLILCLVSLDAGFRDVAEKAGDLSALAFLKTLVLGNRWIPIHGEWNQPAWSVSAEIVGYAFFPWLCKMAMRSSRHLALTVVVALLVGFAGLSVAFGEVGKNDIHAWALVRMAFGFSVGVFLYRVWMSASEREIEIHSALSIISASSIVLLCFFPTSRILTQTIFAVLIYSLASQRGPINQMLSSRTVMFLGKISFPMYLLHVMPLACLIYNLHINSVGDAAMMAAVALYLVALIIVSYVLHVGVERPSHRFARYRTPFFKPAVAHAAIEAQG